MSIAAKPYVTPSSWPSGLPLTLPEALHYRIAKSRDGIYTEVDQSGRHESLKVSTLHDRARAIQSALTNTLAGDACDIVLYVQSVFDCVPALWACFFQGLNVLTIQAPSTAARRFEIDIKLDLAKRKLRHPTIVSTKALLQQLDPQQLEGFETFLLDPFNAPVENGSSTLQSPPANQESAEACQLLFTSGSTSDPKIVIIPFAACLHRNVDMNFTDGRVPLLLNAFPMDSVSGGSIMWPGEHTIYLQPERLLASPHEMLRLTEQYALKNLRLTNTTATMLVRHLDDNPERFDLTCLADLYMGAEMINLDIVERLCLHLSACGAPDLKVAFGYGMTETSLICNAPPVPWKQLRPPGSSMGMPPAVGPCTPGYALRIVDDAGVEQPAGAVGHVECWSETKLFAGYYGDDKLTAESRTADGWFKTGDLGFTSPQGLVLTGRSKATIVIRGRKISLELVETALQSKLSGALATVACAAVRRNTESPEELAVFFVPVPQHAHQLEHLGRKIVAVVAQSSGIRVTHLVPLTSAQFLRTSTGKPRRFELAERFLKGEWPAFQAGSDPGDESDTSSKGPAEAILAQIWKTALKLPFLPAGHANFYELGGDSLASAELLTAMEQKFNCELPFDLLFENPTLAGIADVLKRSVRVAIPKTLDSQNDILHKLKAYAASWRGQRHTTSSMIVGRNTEGRRPPLFWVFQQELEFQQLAAHLGPDQPLYGMRSLVGIRKAAAYSNDILEAVSRQYVPEILAIGQGSPLVIGGNCQGAIIGLAVARQLQKHSKMPLPVVLMEWSYNAGSYPDPVYLLYGAESYTAEIYTSAKVVRTDWRSDFPAATVLEIPGRHGEFFREPNIAGLTAALQSALGSAFGTGHAAPQN